MVAALLLAQAPLTSAALIDELTAQHGYGVIGTSVSPMPPVVLPQAEGAERDAQLKTRWRIVRDSAMPGVFRPEIAPYDDLFEEEKYYRMKNGLSLVPPQLPMVSARDLARPGGVRVRIERLVELLNARALRVPNAYLRRTVLVRIDPARAVEPLPLFAAITGGVPNADGTLGFDPESYRRSAMGTLSFEAQRTDFADDVVSGADRRAYWEQRPLRLAMGASAFHALSEEALRSLARTPRRSLTVPVPRLTEQGPEIVSQLLEAWDRNEARPARVGQVSLPPGTPLIKVSNGSGFGWIGVTAGNSGGVQYL